MGGKRTAPSGAILPQPPALQKSPFAKLDVRCAKFDREEARDAKLDTKAAKLGRAVCGGAGCALCWSQKTREGVCNMTQAKLKTNLDTNLLKLIAICSMLLDHVGSVFFPQIPLFRWIGRLAFPIFCYCLTVGLLYTHDVRKYLTRLGIFALVSQPFYILAFHPVGNSGPTSPTGTSSSPCFSACWACTAEGAEVVAVRPGALHRQLVELRLLRHRHPADADFLPLPQQARGGRRFVHRFLHGRPVSGYPEDPLALMVGGHAWIGPFLPCWPCR